MKRAQLNKILYGTTDPENLIGSKPVPAMTTMLYGVCGNDPAKFDEAVRLVTLFLEFAEKENSK